MQRTFQEDADPEVKQQSIYGFSFTPSNLHKDGPPLDEYLRLDGETHVSHVFLPGDRDRIRQFCTISLLDMLRRRLLASL